MAWYVAFGYHQLLKHSLKNPELSQPKLPIPGDPMEHFLPKTGNPWRNWQQRVEKFDNESCAAWKDEIDKLMVFVSIGAPVNGAKYIVDYKKTNV